MKKKTTTSVLGSRVKSNEEVLGEMEFYRRANFPGATMRYMTSGPNVFDVFLSALGVELGSKTEIKKRGKVVSVLYVLPSLERYNALMALPVAR